MDRCPYCHMALDEDHGPLNMTVPGTGYISLGDHTYQCPVCEQTFRT